MTEVTKPNVGRVVTKITGLVTKKHGGRQGVKKSEKSRRIRRKELWAKDEKR